MLSLVAGLFDPYPGEERPAEPDLPFDELEDHDLAPVRPTLTAAPGYDVPKHTWSFAVPGVLTSDQEADEARERFVTRMDLLRQFQETVIEPPAEEPSPPVEPAEPEPLQTPRRPARTPQIKPQPIRRPSKWRGPNRFAQACIHCKIVVPVGAGLYRDVAGGWEAAHDETGEACWAV